MRFRIIIYLLLSSSLLLAQQRMPYAEPEYDFINLDSSYFQMPGCSVYFDGFYEKMAELIFQGKGNLKIMHIGASHVQAGMWSWALRHAFESLTNYNKTAPGFLFPFSLAKTNHPFFYKSTFNGNWDFQRITDKTEEFPMGLGGITGICCDTLCELNFTFNPVANIQNRSFDKLSLFHNISDDSYIITCIPEDNVKLQFYDYEQSKTVFLLNNPTENLQFSIKKNYKCFEDDKRDEFYLYGILTENNNYGVEVFPIGINGANTGSYLKSELLEKHLCAFDPDLIIFSIGVNDAAGSSFSEERYTANYDSLLFKIREQYPSVAILLTTNTDFYNYRSGHNPNASKVKNSMLINAKKYDAAVWDVHSVMGGNKSINYWRSNNLAQRDRIHFNRDGYTLLGNLLFEAILGDFEKYLVKQTY
ncbi:MAG: hypothetical protein GX879_05965 [Bacteroidales bacterium]|nr:hypothetical protein [Bacteroidales bacterium]